MPKSSRNRNTNETQSEEQMIETEKPKLIWLNILVFSITFLVALIGLPLYLYFEGSDWQTLVAFLVATGFCGMSITAGYHRLWSHKAYQTHSVIRFFYAIGGAFAIQNSALHWSSDHRIHHRFVDNNDKDPYSAKKGFWYSHIGWMLREYQAARYHDYANVKDLQRDPIVVWQHKHYLALVLATNFGIPLLFGLINGNIWGSLLIVGFVRLVVSHHVTFFINSLAHMWGKQPYSDQNTAKDNALVALLTYGEGYHNFHHAFQYDYRNAIKWWQFDPTKWWIKTLDWAGLAYNLKKIPEEKIAHAIAQQQLNRAKSKLSSLQLPDREKLLSDLHREYDLLVEKSQAYFNAKKTLLESKKQQIKQAIDRSTLNQNLSQQYNELRKAFQQQQLSWQLCLAQVG